MLFDTIPSDLFLRDGLIFKIQSAPVGPWIDGPMVTIAAEPSGGPPPVDGAGSACGAISGVLERQVYPRDVLHSGLYPRRTGPSRLSGPCFELSGG
jgi:hypothetical protein